MLKSFANVNWIYSKKKTKHMLLSQKMKAGPMQKPCSTIFFLLNCLLMLTIKRLVREK